MNAPLSISLVVNRTSVEGLSICHGNGNGGQR